MRADGLDADAELGRDLLVRSAVGQQGQHLMLTVGQCRKPPQIGSGVRTAPRALDQSSHAGEELVGVHGLGRVVVRSDEEPGHDVRGCRAIR